MSAFETLLIVSAGTLIGLIAFSWSLRWLVSRRGLRTMLRRGLLAVGRHISRSKNRLKRPEKRPEPDQDVCASYPVKYLSERNSHSLLRWVPWDASGTLFETDRGFHFKGSSPRGRDMEMSFSSEDAMINYQKGNLLWDGGLSWCVIEVDGEKHYFTSDAPEQPDESTQVTPEETTAMYRGLTNRYLRNN